VPCLFNFLNTSLRGTDGDEAIQIKNILIFIDLKTISQSQKNNIFSGSPRRFAARDDEWKVFLYQNQGSN